MRARCRRPDGPLRQTTGFPDDPVVRLSVIHGTAPMILRVRVPSWTAGPPGVTLNGVPLLPLVVPSGSPAVTTGRTSGVAAASAGAAGGWVVVSRHWHSGDYLQVTLPMRLATTAAPDDPAVTAVTYGPVVLSGLYGASYATADATATAAPASSAAATAAPSSGADRNPQLRRPSPPPAPSAASRRIWHLRRLRDLGRLRPAHHPAAQRQRRHPPAPGARHGLDPAHHRPADDLRGDRRRPADHDDPGRPRPARALHRLLALHLTARSGIGVPARCAAWRLGCGRRFTSSGDWTPGVRAAGRRRASPGS